MGMPEEPEYQVFDYACPHCGGAWKEANSVRRHAEFQVCPHCGKRASETAGNEYRKGETR